MESVEAVCGKDPIRNQPWIAMFGGEDVTGYFVICEQVLLIHCQRPYLLHFQPIIVLTWNIQLVQKHFVFYS